MLRSLMRRACSNLARWYRIHPRNGSLRRVQREYGDDRDTCESGHGLILAAA